MAVTKALEERRQGDRGLAEGFLNQPFVSASRVGLSKSSLSASGNSGLKTNLR